MLIYSESGCEFYSKASDDRMRKKNLLLREKFSPPKLTHLQRLTKRTYHRRNLVIWAFSLIQIDRVNLNHAATDSNEQAPIRVSGRFFPQTFSMWQKKGRSSTGVIRVFRGGWTRRHEGSAEWVAAVVIAITITRTITNAFFIGGFNQLGLGSWA